MPPLRKAIAKTDFGRLEKLSTVGRKVDCVLKIGYREQATPLAVLQSPCNVQVVNLRTSLPGAGPSDNGDDEGVSWCKKLSWWTRGAKVS